MKLEEFVEQLGLDGKLKKNTSGNKYFLTNCVFHDDNNPSMSIHENDFFKCFSCREKGKWNKLFFKVKREKFKNKKSYIWDNKLYKKEEEINEVSFRGVLYDPLLVNEYLKKRCISKEFCEYYKIKYSKQSYFNETLFMKRLIIPIYNKGKLISVIGRDVNENSKKKYIYPHNSKHKDVLFNYDNLIHSETLYIAEGIFDLIFFFELGYRNITTCFNNELSKKQLTMVKKFVKLVLLKDNDTGGDKLMHQLLCEYDRDFLIFSSNIEGEDPGSLNIERTKEYINKMMWSYKILQKERKYEW